jgi:hypothetical protein
VAAWETGVLSTQAEKLSAYVATTDEGKRAAEQAAARALAEAEAAEVALNRWAWPASAASPGRVCH